MSYKEFKLQRLDTISPSFCAAKWLQSSFYLQVGTTSSCYYPAPHQIDLNDAKRDIGMFNNTEEKLYQRQQMLVGQRPTECANCWNAEDANTQSFSDRILESYGFGNYDFGKFDTNTNQVPASITVGFDSLCNFSCSYCDDTLSSSWATDLKVNGLYPGIVGDRKKTYQLLKKVDLVDNYEQVFGLFLNYIDTIVDKLQLIHCTGGEPTMSPNFWRFMEHTKSIDTQHVILYITTNLSSSERIQNILKHRDRFKEIRIRASVENIGRRGEFVRKGFRWEGFKSNLDLLLEQGVYVNINSTLSGIALDGLEECIKYIAQLNTPGILTQSLNKITHPNFQNMTVLPKKLRLEYADRLEQVQATVEDRLKAQIQSVIYILRDDYSQFDNVPILILQHSARNFYKEYARRHGFDIGQTFSPMLAEWLLS